ncbi:hypothetical protein OKW18_002045 [Streptomyces pratensis]|nr:hypothetical protein [Streptomyces pratensis]
MGDSPATPTSSPSSWRFLPWPTASPLSVPIAILTPAAADRATDSWAIRCQRTPFSYAEGEVRAGSRSWVVSSSVGTRNWPRSTISARSASSRA